MRFFLKILVSTLAVLITAYIMPGVSVDSYTTALMVALVMALLNIFLKPILVILTVPITLFSFGFFLLIINAFILILAGKMVSGFKIEGFWQAFFCSIVLSLITYLLERLNGAYEKKHPKDIDVD